MMSLLFNMLSRFIIAFLPKSKCLLISWLQSLSAVILEPKKMKSVWRALKQRLPHPTPGDSDSVSLRNLITAFLTSDADAAGSRNPLQEPPTSPVVCKLANFPSAESFL